MAILIALHPETRLIMFKIILIMLLAGVLSNAMADWQLIESNEMQNAYADPATMHKMGDRVILWSMIDLHVAEKLSDNKPFLSWTTQYEFECRNKHSRILAASMHSGKMGSGEITNSLDFDSPKWEAIRPGSKGESLWKFACGKK